MMQISIFNLDCEKPYKIKKPIRLIELFGGIGSQAKALENLQANFTHYRLCEFDKFAIQSYNAVHGTNFTTSDITKITADDLGIVDTDKYEYIMTYSFPCQDLSIAGKQAGMEKGSGTRSGLLWEVERLLEECEELPQILLMENVPQVHGKKNKKSFYKWIEKLESLGYRNYWQDLNAKNYGIPQNRNRTFMVSVLGKYYYVFPKPKKLKLRLKDMLESKVDEKYYLSDKAIKLVTNKMRLDKKYTQINGDIALCHTARNQTNGCGDMVAEPVLKQVAELQGRGFTDCTRRVYSSDGLSPTIQTLQGGNREPKIAIKNVKNLRNEDDIFSTLGTNCGSSTSAGGGVVIQENKIYGWNYKDSVEFSSKPMDGLSKTLRANNDGACAVIKENLNLKIRKLTPKECWRLMGFSDKDFYAAQSAGVSNSQLYKQAGNSIVVNVLEEIFKKLF